MKNENSVVVYDQIMGSGKTHNAILRMNRNRNKTPILYVAPLLDEVDRVLREVPDMYDPKVSSYKDHTGEVIVSYKRDDLLRRAGKKNSLATTHSLFSKLHKNDYNYFKSYDLILDEVITPIEVLKIKIDDIKIALNEGLLVVNESTNEVSFTGDGYEGKFYAELKNYCDTSNVVFVNDQLLVWAFPPEIFKSFRSVTVLTYLFEGSLLANYFKYYDIPYKVIEQPEQEIAEQKNQIADLLNIYEGACNQIGENPTAFSVNWLKRQRPYIFKKISTTVSNMVTRKFNTSSENTAFTTFKSFQSKLKGKGYSKGFIAVNAKATNDYSHKETMIYLANRYLNPSIIAFFRYGGVTVDEDQYALSEMLQWVWRGQIRRGESMNLFIPSRRMRNFLYDWLENYNQEKLHKAA